jgi:hypothetical protein
MIQCADRVKPGANAYAITATTLGTLAESRSQTESMKMTVASLVPGIDERTWKVWRFLLEAVMSDRDIPESSAELVTK